jgi:hypothetical protein
MLFVVKIGVTMTRPEFFTEDTNDSLSDISGTGKGNVGNSV